MRWLAIVVMVAAGCARHRPAAPPDAAPATGEEQLRLPEGNPEQIKRQVEDTLQKEHEKTLQPAVE